ncbi:MAG: HAD family phosphatase [Clostridiales bacterium]|nr:HAD family phosphatase [Clostridiales bacterium]
MFKNIEAVIFDLDGTLVDSMWMWKQIDIDYLEKYNIEMPVDLQEQIEGMSFSETAVYFKEKFNLPDTLDVIKSDWIDMAKEYYMHKVSLKPGVLKLLRVLKKNNIKTGIATSNSIELLDAVLDSLGVRTYFDSIHVACEVAKGKPAPDIYNLVADELGVCHDKCLVFEDIAIGVMAGKAAGMRTCGVGDDFAVLHNDKIKDVAEYFVDNISDIVLEDYFEEI